MATDPASFAQKGKPSSMDKNSTPAPVRESPHLTPYDPLHDPRAWERRFTSNITSGILPIQRKGRRRR